MTKPLVTLAFVNCERLFYLKSCVESFLECTKDYKNKELIIVDNASQEKGTNEYLDELKERGFLVHKTKQRDPINEFAKALNFIVENAKGDYIIALQGDQQAIISGGWLHKYVELFETNPNISYALLDAQRRVRIEQTPHIYEPINKNEEFEFFIDKSRTGIAGAFDVMMRGDIARAFAPWHTENEAFEGTAINSEDEMLKKYRSSNAKHDATIPKIPVSIVLHTDSRGTNARVRGNKRYGDYWRAHHPNGWQYYEIFNYNDMIKKFADRTLPVPIEDVVSTIGFQAPIDMQGNWMKNPIRPEQCSSDDYVTLYKEIQQNEESVNDEYLNEWLND